MEWRRDVRRAKQKRAERGVRRGRDGGGGRGEWLSQEELERQRRDK